MVEFEHRPTHYVLRLRVQRVAFFALVIYALSHAYRYTKEDEDGSAAGRGGV